MFLVFFNFEFLVEGMVICDLEIFDWVLIGGDDLVVVEVLVEIYVNWVF